MSFGGRGGWCRATALTGDVLGRVRLEDVVVLPEEVSTGPLQRARLASLDPLRRARTP